MRPQTGRELQMERLMKACKTAMAADIHRAADFLERAKDIRDGCREQRKDKRLKT